ncbi:MAG: hypothetical protein ABI821_08985 [Pseudomonadota bacterium]
MRKISWLLITSGLCVLVVCSCSREQPPVHPDKQLLTFTEGANQGAFYLYRRGPIGSDYITLEVSDGKGKATLASISTCLFVAARFARGVLEIQFYNSDCFIPDSRGRLLNLAADAPDLAIHSAVHLPSTEKVKELRDNGFVVLDCETSAKMDHTLEDR